MPATNARENILEAVKATLLTISEANGYQNNIGRVERYFVPYEKVSATNEFPAVFILDDGQETNLNDTAGMAGDTTVRAVINLTLVGYYRDTNPATLSTGFNKFKADLDKLWWTDNPPTVLPGTQADDITILGYEGIVTFEQYIVFQLNLQIHYWFLKANP